MQERQRHQHGANSEPCPLRILDGTRQESSEEGKWSWHDEGRPDSFASVVKDEEAPRRRPANMSVSRSTVRKWSILDWSEDAWNSANGTHPDGFGRWNQPAFQGRVPGTPVSDMSGVSGPRLSPQRVPCRPSPLSQYYLLKHVCLATFRQSASGNWTFHAGVPITGTQKLNLSAESKTGSGAGDRHGQDAHAVHPVNFRERSSTGYDCNVGFE